MAEGWGEGMAQVQKHRGGGASRFIFHFDYMIQSRNYWHLALVLALKKQPSPGELSLYLGKNAGQTVV